MSSKEILSLVIPVTKMAGRLNILRSWFENLDIEKLEIIFVHDISDQGTSNQLKEMIANSKFTNCQLIEGNFGSPGAARNRGLLECKGKWISFWDSDDFVYVDAYLELLINVDPDVDLLVGNYEVCDICRARYS